MKKQSLMSWPALGLIGSALIALGCKDRTADGTRAEELTYLSRIMNSDLCSHAGLEIVSRECITPVMPSIAANVAVISRSLVNLNGPQQRSSS